MGFPHAPPVLDSPVVAPFWEALDRGELRLPACSECGRWQWYPGEAVVCHPGAPLDWREVAGTGRLYTFTTVERAFLPGGADDVPFVVGLVELDGVVGPRLVTVLEVEGGGEPAVGDRVHLHPVRLSTHTLPVFVVDRAAGSG